MPNYRATLFLGQSTNSATETYITPDVTIGAAASMLSTLFSLRAALLTTLHQINGVRVAQYGTRRASKLIRPPGGQIQGSGSFLTLPPGGSTPPSGANFPDPWRSNLQLDYLYLTNSHTQRYLAGIPDSVVGTEPITWLPSGNTAWVTSLTNYTTFLTGQFQLESQQYPPTVKVLQVIGVVSQLPAPGLLGVVVDNTAGSVLTRGQKIAVQGFRPPKFVRASTLNGTWTLASVDASAGPAATILYLNGSAGLDPAAQRISPPNTIVRPVFKQLNTIQWIDPKAVVPHKRGKPGLSPRGRRLTRRSLDP